MLDSKHDHSTKCSKAGCICLSAETPGDDLEEKPRVSGEEIGPGTQLLPPEVKNSQGQSPSGYSKLDNDDTSEGDEKEHLEKFVTVKVTEV